MDINRAKEIMQSDDNIEVLYKGSQVWLQSADNESQMVNATILNNNTSIKVPAIELRETQKKS